MAGINKALHLTIIILMYEYWSYMHVNKYEIYIIYIVIYIYKNIYGSTYKSEYKVLLLILNY